MPNAIRALSRLQFGREATRGAVVTPQRRFAFRTATHTDETIVEPYEDEPSGSLAASRYAPTIQGRGSAFETEFALDLGSLALMPLLGGIQGMGAAVVAGAAYAEFDGLGSQNYAIATTQGSGNNEISVTTAAPTTMVIRGSANATRTAALDLLIVRGRPFAVGTALGTYDHQSIIESVVRDAAAGTPRWTVVMADAWAATAASGRNLFGGRADWLFEPDTARVAADLPDVFSAEFAEADAAGAGYVRRAGYAYLESATIAASLGTPTPTLSMSMRGRGAADSTNQLALPATRLTPSGMKFALYDDAAWAGLGTTQIEGRMLGFEWALTPGVAIEDSMDGRGTLDFVGASRLGPRIVDLSVTVAFDPSATGYVRLHEGYKNNRVRRFMRLEVTGPEIPNIPGATTRLALEGCYAHQGESLAERGTDQDGRMVRTFNLRSILDPASDRDIGAALDSDAGLF